MNIQAEYYLNKIAISLYEQVEDDEHWDNEDSNVNFNGER